MGEVKKVSNVHSKMQKVRRLLAEADLKKSGYNKFAGFNYFELSDFLPKIIELLDDHNLCSRMSFGKEEAVLTIYNSENPDEKMEFTSPMSTAAVAKNGNEVQNLGAVQTYLRRYLYVAAFEIVENDGLDATVDKPLNSTVPKNDNSNKVNQQKIKRIEELLKQTQQDINAFTQYLNANFGTQNLNDLTLPQLEQVLSILNSMVRNNA
ncbi:ERF family protein [Turicibacter sanguinis]|uniref:ERF family protein n=1 Tax=Turicibacter sanguinis TaxID=154288 RepID=UPI002942A7BC|nr:ERF family protein [Turicibacter sanguinis]